MPKHNEVRGGTACWKALNTREHSRGEVILVNGVEDRKKNGG